MARPLCVVDTSAIAAIAWGEPEGAVVADAIKGMRLLASPMMVWEMANLLLTKLRRHPEEVESLRLAYDWFLQLELTIVPVPECDVIACGQRYSLTAYDAGYLALAMDLHVPLVTLDKKLARAWQAATLH
jgi:predicted nucleic acid-binding protein